MRNINGILLLLLAVACGEVVPVGEGGGVDASPPPTIQSVAPDHGPIAGGIEVTVTGTGFQSGDAGDAQAVVGGFLSPSTTVVDDGTVTFIAPAGLREGEVVDVTIFNQNGHVTLPASFRYNEVPVVLSISPARGRASGGTNVTIVGRGFENLEAGSATVTIDGVAAANVVVVDDQTITATTAAAPGSPAFAPLAVVVTNANGADVLEDAFELTRQGLLAVERCCQNRVFYIEPLTGDVKEVGRTTRRIHSCVRGPAGNLFAVSRRTVDSQMELVTFEPLTGTVTAIGVTTDGTNNRQIGALAFVGSQLYGITSKTTLFGANAFFLVSVNTSTGAVAQVGAAQVTNTQSFGIATRDTGSLYFADRTNETLNSITVSNAAVTTGPTMDESTPLFIHGLAEFDGAMYALEGRTGSRVWSVDTTTGALTEVATLPSIASGLCETPATF